MPKRTYRQFCAIARALDVVGDRWTLLLIRELLMGPRRFTDLLHELPGIGTNLLAARLKQLESAGLIRRRTMPAPAPSTVYELADLGRDLEPVVAALHDWGSRNNQDGPQQGEKFRPAWSLVGMRYGFNADAARGVHETYEYRIGTETFHVRVADGRVETGNGPAHDPDMVLTTDSFTYFSIVAGRLGLYDAKDFGAVKVSGDESIMHRSARILGLVPA